MHHLYPLNKGDPLCPLGFHPQVRWPTRCKRCFRDYKEHGGKKRDEELSIRRNATTASTPSLASWGSASKEKEGRSWASSTNLASNQTSKNSVGGESKSNDNMPSSWTSTPDLASLNDDTQANIPTVSIKLPKKRQLSLDTGQKPDRKLEKYNKTDSLAARAKKLQAIKEATSNERSKRIQIKEIRSAVEEPTNHDVQFLIQVKSKKHRGGENNEDAADSEEDTLSTAGTEATDTTLVGQNESELKEQLDSIKQELETTKARCERLEREKSDILLRRLAAMETTTSKTTATEVLKLKQKCNDLQSQLDDYRDEKKSLGLRVRELEEELEIRPTAQSAQKVADELRSKLLAAETLCEELMDENEDMKKELRDMEEQMDEMQDNFREDQAIEYTSLKKELEQTTKNCRILSFKLRKSERKADQLETEKAETEKKLKEISGSNAALSNLERIKHLEQELKVANEVTVRLQTELEETAARLNKAEEATKTSPSTKKAPMLGTLGKLPSGDKKVSRESLTRGGSQDDPAQLLRDLQDSLEREADLREQLKFAEEEAQNLRKKTSRIEDDNESLVLQLKKMATRARSRKLSPTNVHLSTETGEKGESASDEEDPAELKLLLELNEQEASVLRKKIEELESENERLKKKTKDLHDKLTAKAVTKKSVSYDTKENSSIRDKKVKVLEDEANELRKKLIEKERDCERLHAELSLNKKRSKGMQKSKSLDLDQQTLDLKRQLQVTEQETSVLRAKVQSLENDNEKLTAENKQMQLLRGTKNMKTDKSLDIYIDKIATLEVELGDANKKIKELEDTISQKPNKSARNVDNTLKQELAEAKGERDKLSEALKKLQESSAKSFKNRTPKKPSSFASKEQLKTMINELEAEIGDMMVAIKNSETKAAKLEEEIEQLKENSKDGGPDKEKGELKKRINELQKELENERAKTENEKGRHGDLENKLQGTRDDLNNVNAELSTIKDECNRHKNKYLVLLEEKCRLEKEMAAIKSEKEILTNKENEISIVKQTADDLRKQLAEKSDQIAKLNRDLEEKNKLSKDSTTKTKSMEKQIEELEEKSKKLDKTKKDQIKQLEKTMDEIKSKLASKENDCDELNLKRENDKKNFNSQIDDLNTKIKTLENTLDSKNQFIQQLEESLRKEREATLAKANREESDLSEKLMLNALSDELNKSKVNLSETEQKLESAQKTKKTLEEKLKRLENDSKKEKLSLEKKMAEIEIELQNERKKLDVMKANQEKEQKNRELELGSLRSKIKTLEMSSGSGSKKIADVKKEYQERIDKLEKTLAMEKTKYEDLTAKYEVLEEEHVVTKAKLVMEKESLSSQLLSTDRELEDIQNELQTLRETYNNKQDTWIKEKLEMNEKLKDAGKRPHNGGELERARLKGALEEKQLEFEQMKKEHSYLNDQLQYLKRENEELRKKLDDFDKVSKIQRNISADSSAMEKEIKQLKTKLVNMEKAKKADLAQYKMRYESQIVAINEELQSLQNQVVRFKREKDTYKHMLESAQKTIGDLKTTTKAPKENFSNIPTYDELEESRTKVATLEQQINCMEDELSEARLESSRLKTELVSERSTWEVKISELHSRINELEEEKVLSSGRTKIAGLRTRMELAWHKEREEQQRLLQETATLARDLRQTLFEVERERDKERLEAKRKQEQLKKVSEEDVEENKKKLTELQCDLLELRDAHAKLRTTNEKLRREKERYEKERESLRSIVNEKRRVEQEDDRRITALLEQVDALVHVAPELFENKNKETDTYTPTPPRRTKGPKSRESSPALEKRDGSREVSLVREDRKSQMQSTMQKLMHATEELKRYQKLNEEDRERERIKRSMGMRRATSTEHENPASIGKTGGHFTRNNSTTSSLHRKSLSLEYTSLQNEQAIWKGDDDSLSSLQSLNAVSDERWMRRDNSLDSRLSGGSTQSEAAGGEKKKKKGIIGKMKKLVKSRSIDDQDPEIFSPNGSLSKPSSNADVNDETRSSRKDLKERLTGMFKRGGSSSRSNSLERQHSDTRSTQRPLMANGSQTLKNPSSSNSDIPKKSRKATE